MLALLGGGCTALSGDCLREVTVTTKCEAQGSAVILPGTN